MRLSYSDRKVMLLVFFLVLGILLAVTGFDFNELLATR